MAKHSTVSHSLKLDQLMDFRFNCNLLNKSASLMRVAWCTVLWVYKMSLGLISLLCSISRIREIDFSQDSCLSMVLISMRKPHELDNSHKENI